MKKYLKTSVIDVRCLCLVCRRDIWAQRGSEEAYRLVNPPHYSTSSHGSPRSLLSPFLSPIYHFVHPLYSRPTSVSTMDGDELSKHFAYYPRPPSSSAFDIPIPDYLPLRRVKPLPKRKRSSPDPARSLPLNTLLPPILPPPPGPDATAEELIAHAEVLSAQITLQSYFLPSLSGGVADFNRRDSSRSSCSSGGVDMPLGEAPRPPTVNTDVTVTPAPNDGREGDHMDSSQQQGNAKKRKVPAHLSGSQMGLDSADVHSGEDEQQLMPPGGGERTPSNFACAAEAMASAAAGAAPEEEAFDGGAEADGRHGKVLPATMVGLRQKQVLKHRRRQLAALLGSGSPSLGDSIALEQALLANTYALLNDNRPSVGRNVRLKRRLKKRRRASRVIRRHCTVAPPPASDRTRRIFPDGEFTFLSSNAGVSPFGSIHGVCAHSPTV